MRVQSVARRGNSCARDTVIVRQNRSERNTNMEDNTNAEEMLSNLRSEIKTGQLPGPLQYLPNIANLAQNIHADGGWTLSNTQQEIGVATRRSPAEGGGNT